MALGANGGARIDALAGRFDWLVCFLAGTAVVLVGVAFGRAFVPPAPGHATAGEPFLNSLFHWDGNYYRDIATSGYNYDPRRQSSVHFFPLYPLAARAVMAATGLPADLALLLTTCVSFAAALYLLGRYAELRGGADGEAVRIGCLMALGFLPAGLFFRVAYSESLFLFLCISALYLIERRAPPLAVALVVGLATAARPVGIGLVPALLLYLARQAPDPWAMVRSTCLYLPLSCSGLLAFILYCGAAFGDPFAFAHNMRLWHMLPQPPTPDKLLSLASLEPVWSIFTPGTQPFYGNYTAGGPAAFSLYVANPLYFVAALALLAVGIWRGWLSTYEILVGAGLLLIPYWSAGYEAQMTGMARYVTVIPPLYLVLGRLFAQAPSSLGLGLLALGSAFLATYAALFAQWYWFV